MNTVLKNYKKVSNKSGEVASAKYLKTRGVFFLNCVKNLKVADDAVCSVNSTKL